MKRFLSFVLILVMIFCFMLTSCSEDGDVVSSEISSKKTYSDSTSGISQTEQEGDFTFAFNPYVISNEALQGMEGNKYYNKFVKAVLNRESSVEIPSQEDYDNIRFASGEFFPFLTLVDTFGYNTEKKEIYIEYKYKEKEHNQIISDFKAEIQSIFDECVTNTDDDVMAAMSVYRWIATNISVVKIETNKKDDEDTVSSSISESEEQNDEKIDLFSTLINKKGNEYTIASLYNFLLKQLGIDGKTVSAWVKNNYRTWNMICLDDEWYHCDIIKEIEKTEGTGLVYFGLDAKAVKSYISSEKFYTGEWNWFTEDIPDADDDRFGDFRKVKSWTPSTSRKEIKAFTIDFSNFVWKI